MKFANIQARLKDFPEPVEAYGFLIPETFQTYFLIEDEEFNQRWSIEMKVKIEEAGSPVALEVITRGFTYAKRFNKDFLPFEDLSPVSRAQIEATKTALGELLVISTLYAIEFFRYEGTKENWIIPLQIKRSSLDSSSWELGSKGFQNIDSKTLRKQIEKYQDRRPLSQEDHLLTARLVAEEVERAKSEGKRSRHNQVIMDKFGLTIHGAEFRVKRAKDEGFLTKDNKVSAKKAGKTKGLK